MKLKVYRKKIGVSQSVAAKQLGVSKETFISWETEGTRRKKIPRLVAMEEICKWSGGLVTANDFYDIPESEEE